MNLSPSSQILNLRPPAHVMSLPRLGCLFASRLSFSRSLTRQMAREHWQITHVRFDLNNAGHGTAIYRLTTPHGCYHGVMFSQPLAPAQRSDRVIAEAWDVTFGLVEGEVDDALLQDMAANVPLQEAGRQHPRVLVLSRANRSGRMFDHCLQRLAEGQQPDAEMLANTGYLYRTTAVYGNGKFGIADFSRLHDNPDFYRPFASQMLAVYLLRHFSTQQIEHIAQALAPSTCTTLTPDVKRYLGIGNATGLGMAPFLINHPQLIQQWVHCREHALALTASQVPDETSRDRLLALMQRAVTHLNQIQVSDANQQLQNQTIAAELPEVINWLQLVPLGTDLWQQLIDWSEAALAMETQELINTLLLELYPDLVDPLEDFMGVDERIELEPGMPVAQFKQLLDTHFDWAIDEDFTDPDSRYWFWYRSAEKEEPRLGVRGQEPGEEKELSLAIAPRVSRLHAELSEFLEIQPRASVVEFLMTNPRQTDIVRRVQSMVTTPYGEIRANLWHRDMKPIHLLRTKLAFFGAGRFDPLSDRWVRVTLFQGAPLAEHIHTEADNPLDDWSFALAPETGTRSTTAQAE